MPESNIDVINECVTRVLAKTEARRIIFDREQDITDYYTLDMLTDKIYSEMIQEDVLDKVVTVCLNYAEAEEDRQKLVVETEQLSNVIEELSRECFM